MTKCIDAAAFKEYINNVSTHWLNDWSTLGVLAAIDKQPAVDVVPAVRCRACKYSKEQSRDTGGFFTCPATGALMCDDDYCSYGLPGEDD